MSNIRSFSLFPTLSDSLLSNRFDQMDRLFSQLTGNRPLTSEHPYNLKQINESNKIPVKQKTENQNQNTVWNSEAAIILDIKQS